MSRRLSGINPLAYIGVEPTAPPLLRVERRAPTVNDMQNVNIGTIWLNELTEIIYMLVSLSGSVATWAQIFPAINAGAITFHGDTGTAVPVSNIINMVGGRNLTSSASGSSVTFDLDDNVTIAGPLTITSMTDGLVSCVLGELVGSAGNNGQVMIGETGGDPIWANLTAGANISITNGPNSITIAGTGGGGAGDVTVVTDSGSAVSLTGSINFTAGSNIATHATAAHTFVANLVDSPTVSGRVTAGTGFVAVTGNVNIQSGNLELPNTSMDETEGEIRFGGNRWVSNYGSANTFLGQSSGNTGLITADATDNTAVGFSVLNLLTTGEGNTGFGDVAMTALTTGDFNSAFGNNALIGLIAGNNNAAFGNNAGANYTGAESSNILINNAGTVGESNTIRIGTQGSGAGQQQDAYIAGVYAPITPLNSTYNIALVDLQGKLGSTNATANGQLLIGSAAGSATWATLTAGAGIGILNTPNGITISSTGSATGGVSLFHTNTADATEDLSNTSITLLGTSPITTSGSNHTVSIGLTNGTNGQVLIAGGANPAWANLASAGGTVTITNTANGINLESAAGGGTSTYHTDSGTAVPASSVITVAGGLNINTTGSGSTITVATNNSINVPTTANNTTGVYKINNLRFLHSYGTKNTFVGSVAGNFTLSTGSAISNTAVGQASMGLITTGASNSALGYFSLGALTTGNNNTAVGYLSMNSLTTGVSNTAIGSNSLKGITTGTSNIAVGNNAGANLVTSNSNNIMIGNAGVSGDQHTTRIGATGTGTAQQTSCYIGGITPITYTGTTLVTVSGNDKLGILNNGATSPGQIVLFDSVNNITTGSLTSSNNSILFSRTSNNINMAVNYVTWYAYQTSYTPVPVTGDGTIYMLGTQAGFTKLFDPDNVISNTTTGQTLTITIPITGYYYLQISVAGSPVLPPNPLPPYQDSPTLLPSPVAIFVNGTQRWLYWGAGLDQTAYLLRTLSYSTVAQLNAGDKLTYSAMAMLSPSAKTTYIGGGYSTSSNNIGVTYVTGHLISPL